MYMSYIFYIDQEKYILWLDLTLFRSEKRKKNHNFNPINLNSPTNHNHHQKNYKPTKRSFSLYFFDLWLYLSVFFFSSLTAGFELLTGRSATSSHRSMPLFFSVAADMWMCN